MIDPPPATCGCKVGRSGRSRGCKQDGHGDRGLPGGLPGAGDARAGREVECWGCAQGEGSGEAGEGRSATVGVVVLFRNGPCVNG